MTEEKKPKTTKMKENNEPTKDMYIPSEKRMTTGASLSTWNAPLSCLIDIT